MTVFCGLYSPVRDISSCANMSCSITQATHDDFGTSKAGNVCRARTRGRKTQYTFTHRRLVTCSAPALDRGINMACSWRLSWPSTRRERSWPSTFGLMPRVALAQSPGQVWSPILRNNRSLSKLYLADRIKNRLCPPRREVTSPQISQQYVSPSYTSPLLDRR